jgi:GntR family transcriptional regulator
MPARSPDAKAAAIADAIRAQIESGDLPPGARVPSENQLAEHWGVAPLTARAGLAVLKQEGLLIARRGSGTRVRSSQPIRRRASGRLSVGVWQAGRSIWSADLPEHRQVLVDQLRVDQLPAPEHVAYVLDLPSGAPVCRRSRRYVLDGQPVMLATSWLSADLVAGSAITEHDTGPGGIYARLAELGHKPVHFKEQLRGRMPTQDEIQRLKLSTGSSVMQVARTAYTSEGRVVELAEQLADANAYIFEYDIDA